MQVTEFAIKKSKIDFYCKIEHKTFYYSFFKKRIF